MEVTKIVTTFMATVDVIKQADRDRRQYDYLRTDIVYWNR